MKWDKEKTKMALSYILVIFGTAITSFYLYVHFFPLTPPTSPEASQGDISESSQPQEFPSVLPNFPLDMQEQPPDNKLFITGERQLYKGGDMRLVIPKLSLDVQIANGVDSEALKRGPGLYDYSQLPGTGNRNVSIAGHRDIHGSPFYYIDTLSENDYFYIIWDNMVYRYTYKDTTIVKADDWGPIYSQGFSCLTLTSCDPIGTSLNRIIVRAELSERVPYKESYTFETAYRP